MHRSTIIFLLILSAFQVLASDPESKFPKNLIIHDKPIAYKNTTFYDQKDEKFDLASFNKKLFIVYFFASWCGDCIDEIKQLEALQQKIGNNNLLVIPISEDYKPRHEVIDDLAGRFKLEAKIFFDNKNELYKELKIKTIPSAVIVTKDREEIARVTGRGSWEDSYMQSIILKYLDKVN